MDKDKKVLYRLDELSDRKVASDYSDVRGWEVVDRDNHVIGEVDDLLVNKDTERVVYLDVEVDDSLKTGGQEANLDTPANKGTHEFINKDGENHLIIPIGVVDIDEDNKKVYTNEIGYENFRRTRMISKGTSIDRDYEKNTFRNYFPNTLDERWDDPNFYDRREFRTRTYRNPRTQ